MWFDAGVNYGISSFGSSFGWILNFHPCGFNFFVGMDHLMTKVTPQYIPVGKLNTNVSVGFNAVTFGKNRSGYQKQKQTEHTDNICSVCLVLSPYIFFFFTRLLTLAKIITFVNKPNYNTYVPFKI